MRRQQSAEAWSIFAARVIMMTGAYIALRCAVASASRDSHLRRDRQLLDAAEPGEIYGCCDGEAVARAYPREPSNKCDRGLYCYHGTLEGPGYCLKQAGPRKKGESCGFLPTPGQTSDCGPGLTCNKMGQDPNLADFPGVCVVEAGRPGTKGGSCGGFISNPVSCEAGLVCSHKDNLVADFPGKCVDQPGPGKEGDICGSLTLIVCGQGLKCDGSKLPEVCIKDTCYKCAEDTGTVCAIDPDTKQRGTYASRCLAICNNATSIRNGDCPLKT